MKLSHALIAMVFGAALLAACAEPHSHSSTPPTSQPASRPTARDASSTIPVTVVATWDADELKEPIGIALLSDTIAVSDPGAGAIHLFDRDGNWKRAISATGGGFSLDRPMHIATDFRGRLIVPDYLRDTVSVMTLEGDLSLVLGAHGSMLGQLDAPAGVAAAGDGTIYVADFNNHRVQHFAADGEVIGVLGAEGHGPGGFYYPTDVAVGRDGHVYIADAYNHRIQVLEPDGTPVASWGAAGRRTRRVRRSDRFGDRQEGARICRRPVQSSDSGIRFWRSFVGRLGWTRQWAGAIRPPERCCGR